MRAFVALDLDAGSLDAITVTAAAVRAASPSTWKASWVAPRSMHVTVQFLGETDETLAPALGEALVAIARASAAPPPSVAAVTAFPSEVRARVLVAELTDASGALGRVAGAVAAAMEPHGFAREARPYRPHVTLARLRVPRDVHPIVVASGVASLALGVASLTLFRSDPGPRGPAYTPLARAAFPSLRS
jgi:2'-5' RNA ligase